MNLNEHILIARIHRAHGIRGGAALTLAHARESILEVGLKTLLIPLKLNNGKVSKLPPEGQEFIISKLSLLQNPFLYFEGIDSRNRIEDLLPCGIYLQRRFFPELKEKEFYWVDLIGCKIYEDFDGPSIGVLESIYENGAQAIFVIKLDEENEKLEIPFIKNFIKEIQIANKKILIHRPEFIE